MQQVHPPPPPILKLHTLVPISNQYEFMRKYFFSWQQKFAKYLIRIELRGILFTKGDRGVHVYVLGRTGGEEGSGLIMSGWFRFLLIHIFYFRAIYRVISLIFRNFPSWGKERWIYELLLNLHYESIFVYIIKENNLIRNMET